MRVIHGVDLGTVNEDQFHGCVQGRTLILDGDGPCYVASATTKRLDTALRRFQQEVLKRMFMAGAQNCHVHLTAHNSDKHGRFRVKAFKPYQGNRTSKAKPALLEPLRELVADNSTWLEEYDVLLHRELEADDGMMQDAYRLGEHGVISSEDKDLRMTPFLYYELDRGTVAASQPIGHVTLKCTEAGNVKLAGQGPMFFWGQMLCGDQADNIRGIDRFNGKLCGPALAYEVLKDCTSVHDAANIVIDGYRNINQNVLAEGWLLWLTRRPGDNVVKYMNELDLTTQNADFVQDCLRRDWVLPKEDNARTDD